MKFSSTGFHGTLIAICSALLLSMTVASAMAEGYRDQWHPTIMEISRLPNYCHGQFRPELRGTPGYKIVNCGNYYNHFCPGLVMLNRASDLTKPKAVRRDILREARLEIGYIRGFPLPQNCPILPDIEAAEARLRMQEMLAK